MLYNWCRGGQAGSVSGYAFASLSSTKLRVSVLCVFNESISPASIGQKVRPGVMRSFTLLVATDIYYGKNTFLNLRQVNSFLRV